MSAPAVAVQEEEALGKAYDARIMRRLLGYVRPYGALVAGSLILLAIEGLLQLVGPLITQRVIDVALPAHDVPAVGRMALLFVAALAGAFAASYGETLLTSLLGQRVMRDLRDQLFGHLQRLPIAFFDRNPVGRLITRVTSDVEALNELFTAGVVSGMGDLFTLLAISVMMLVVDWRLALASFAVIPFVWLTSSLFQRSVRSAYRDIRTRLARINAFLQERITGMRIVQLFGREPDEAQRFDALNRAHLDAHLKSITVYALYFPAIEVLTTVALASLIVAGARRVELGVLTVGTVAAFLQLVRRFFEPLQDLSDKYNMLQQAMAASERIFRLLDTPAALGVGHGARGRGTAELVGRGPGILAAENALHLAPPSAPHSTPHTVTVEFENVWFAYDTAHVAAANPTGADGTAAATGERAPEWVLKGVSFRAAPGQTVALVGHTGAGKTTIVNLLLRFYDPQRGRITANGVDIREMPLGELRALIGYVQQDIFLFAGDVASNIRLSNALSDEAVAAAATRVGADRIIRRLPGGYAHVLGERGASVSVGERQLLSFARAIAGDPALLILDEATSAVDSLIEAEIQRALQVLMAGRTTIAIAHRLSTIVEADEILVLHHGQVRERGTHRQLLAKQGLYERLYRLQTGVLAGANRTERTQRERAGA
ncbi:MAG TPA: ABC transporter ATP-binding protein [Gemmatimonadaceae bacterium]|nr:ABC transporter ATP-binding protein [Gemmatimonadaceae bacterium]